MFLQFRIFSESISTLRTSTQNLFWLDVFNYCHARILKLAKLTDSYIDLFLASSLLKLACANLYQEADVSAHIYCLTRFLKNCSDNLIQPNLKCKKPLFGALAPNWTVRISWIDLLFRKTKRSNCTVAKTFVNQTLRYFMNKI